MKHFDAAPVLAGLTEFQRRSVEHVTSRFYGPDQARRFLIADETGLGKSLVAKGVIARTIEKLQNEPGQRRINIVYVCSNGDLARQNLSKLDVLGRGRHSPFASRLSMLAKHSKVLQPDTSTAEIAVNLVSFTPGTSFSQGWQTGKAEERALLLILLNQELELDGWGYRAALNVLRDTVGRADAATGADRFRGVVERLEAELDGPPDPAVSQAFLSAAREQGLIAQFMDAVEDQGRKHALPDDLAAEVRPLIGKMRTELSRAGLHVLDPDLVILDEFQRFRELLDPTTDSGELAHLLFDYPSTKVLLLSATPYKPYTYAEESDDDHQREFLKTLEFLSVGTSLTADVKDDLSAYRTAVVAGAPVDHLVQRIRDTLLQVMSRHERPTGVAGGMHEEHVRVVSDLSPDDLVAFVRLTELSEHVQGDVSLEYWKSTPYFTNFCDGYKLSEKVRQAVRGVHDPKLDAVLARLPQIDREAVTMRGELDLGNAKLRALANQTVDQGWWKLLWLPASLPYLEPAGPYAEPWTQQMTKLLIFSSWSATPTAIASLLSQRAEHHLRAARQGEAVPASAETRRQLAYNLDGGRAAAMTALALFWPMPDLARRADPLAAAKAVGAPVSRSQAETAVVRWLREGHTKWEAAPVAAAAGQALALPGSLPDSLRDGSRTARQHLLTGLGAADETDDDVDASKGLLAHVDEALRLRADGPDGSSPALAPTMAAIAAHAPGNIAWRALSRLLGPETLVTEEGHWVAAAVLATGLRSMFGRPDSVQLIEHLDDRGAYWQKVLRYCADGNLQAVLDEYVHHLTLAGGGGAKDDDDLLKLAKSASAALSLRPATYSAFDPRQPDDAIRLSSRIALRYGGRQKDESSRLPEVRQAFNSPFWPFVLASTSVGQEGIDFHWWCSSLLHWNTPANPVDFEQREGRIDRYAGHAVRRNLADKHGVAMLGAANPWDAAYELGRDLQPELGEFAPHWVYPGPARIQRTLLPYPLSQDVARLQQLKADLALYRLTFGQPRQEDMLNLIKQAEGAHTRSNVSIDLSPPDYQPPHPPFPRE